MSDPIRQLIPIIGAIIFETSDSSKVTATIPNNDIKKTGAISVMHPPAKSDRNATALPTINKKKPMSSNILFPSLMNNWMKVPLSFFALTCFLL